MMISRQTFLRITGLSLAAMAFVGVSSAIAICGISKTAVINKRFTFFIFPSCMFGIVNFIYRKYTI